MDKLDELITNYKKLCQWCDTFFESIQKIYPKEMVCTEGCASCCTLQSVNQLEAFMIQNYLADHKLESFNNDKIGCPFLIKNFCTIYSARPIICRSHGLVLFDSEDSTVTRSCHLTFSQVEPSQVEKEHLLDIQKITETLSRFNVLHCMLNSIKLSDIERVLLRDLHPLIN